MKASELGSLRYCLNFLSILDLPINLTLSALRFEFDISWLIVCVPSQNLEFLIITFLVVLHTKANKCGKNESERAGKALC